MTTLKQLTDATMRKLQGYGLSQPRVAFLTTDVSDTDLAWNVSSTADISQGLAEIDNELVFVESVDDEAKVISLSPDGRGYFGTTPAAHTANTRVTIAPVWPRIDIESAINEAIVNAYPDIFGVASTSFTFNAAVATYELPAEVETVLKVTADTVGPSNEQQNVRRYQYDSTASSEFSTGNVLTVQEGVFPGRVVTVTYAKQPTPLTDGDDLSVSGLRESATTALVYYACSQLLSYMDPSRLVVNTAQADEYDTRNAVGTAQKIANTLYARYEMELDRERRRLRETYKVPFHIRSR